jgi:hypothetical protein
VPDVWICEVPDVWICEVLPPVLQLTEHCLKLLAAAASSDQQPAAAGIRCGGFVPIYDPQISTKMCLVYLLAILRQIMSQCCSKQSHSAEPTASSAGNQPTLAAAAASAAAEMGAAFGGPRTSKQRQLLQDYCPPTGQHLTQLLSFFERFVRLVPSAASSVPQQVVWMLEGGLQDVAGMLTGPLMDPVYAAGPHSAEQQQLLSLISSLLKLHKSRAVSSM